MKMQIRYTEGDFIPAARLKRAIYSSNNESIDYHQHKRVLEENDCPRIRSSYRTRILLNK